MEKEAAEKGAKTHNERLAGQEVYNRFTGEQDTVQRIYPYEKFTDSWEIYVEYLSKNVTTYSDFILNYNHR